MPDLKIVKPATPQLEVTFNPTTIKIDVKNKRVMAEMESSVERVDFESTVGRPIVTFSDDEMQKIVDLVKTKLRAAYPELTF